MEDPLCPLAALSHVGRWRPSNQDAVAVAEAPGRVVLAVCDGVSASAHSELAARYVADTLVELLRGGQEAPSAEELRGLLRQVHRSVCEEARRWEGAALPGTTAVTAVLQGSRLVVGWVGDSRAYWVSQGGELLLTRDHSWVNEVVARGEMSLQEAQASANAHAITRCIGPLEGSGSEAEPDAAGHELEGPGVLILCTDGLWNYTPEPGDLRGLVGPEQDARSIAGALVDHALRSGGRDNITVAVYRYTPAR
jgi:serine/threonine protein phosphatase PrpC